VNFRGLVAPRASSRSRATMRPVDIAHVIYELQQLQRTQGRIMVDAVTDDDGDDYDIVSIRPYTHIDINGVTRQRAAIHLVRR
jgi:hypothetical protein